MFIRFYQIEHVCLIFLVVENLMQNLHLDSLVVGITSHKQSFAFCLEDGSVCIGNSKNGTVDLEISLPANSDKINRIVWSMDGDFIYVSSHDTLYFFRPATNYSVESIKLPKPIENVFPHKDGYSSIVLFVDSSFCIVNPSPTFNPNILSLVSESERIVSFVVYKQQIAMVVDGPNPQIRFLDSKSISIDTQKVIEIEQHDAVISSAVSSEAGIVIQRADGFWTRYTDISSISGNSASSLFIDVQGTYMCASCGDCVRIYDLKFDAELQKIDVNAQQAIIFESNIVAISETEVHFREWKGLKSTSTRDLILSHINGQNEGEKDDTKNDDQIECEEIKIAFQEIEADNSHPIITEVIQSKAESKFRSVSSVINNIMDNKFVPINLRQKVHEIIQDPAYDDVRDLALFHLSTSIPYSDVEKALLEGKALNVVMMLKKIEPLNGQQIASFIKLALKSLDDNEIVLAHFLTQPLNEVAAAEAAKILNADEVDSLLEFLARMLASRRYWREFEASLTALDSVNRWASILIKANVTVLALQKKTKGLVMLQDELKRETERIKAAATCWSIVENITENQMDAVPPSFMYLVSTINIPE
ncbi:hypothetical protein TRFO_23305 [Tritrichomonas foetus]|uniref:Uncharacterized protein n=1 Tax=Tritrichomonas foetus TaxID=1144522 RepID=A0A1J4KF58_9EUKA|nr:hypothetical protein TRFO_23305 [Tritrichomonas foetus]|eukprot:OHT08230.1 hypothetical protein TRFO_23305 [Tritrichomonas foetus]